MKQIKKYFLFFIFFSLGGFVYGQQLPQFTSYQLSPFLYNPAYAGVDGFTEINAVVREQWTGIEKAPETKVLSMYGPLRNSKMGLGGLVYSDKLGAESKNGIQLAYSYHLKLRESLKLSLGISGGLMQYKIDNTSINTYDANDPLFNIPGHVDVVPTASFGAFVYSEKYYVSLAIPQLLNSSFSGYNDPDEEVNLLEGSKLASHYYLSAGYKYQMNESLRLEPSLLVKMVAGQLQFELTSKVIYKDILWSALGYRNEDAAILFLGYDINDRFYVAYGHELTTSELSQVSSGTHEFKFGIRFNKD